jgi:hypothetical protein
MICSQTFGASANGEVGLGYTDSDGEGLGPGKSVRIGDEKKERTGKLGRPREM